MNKITGNKLRRKFLDYFKDKNHTIISSASLIPENDPTVLFTTAGMHPLVPFLLGEKHPSGSRLANVQKCWRTGDIEEVGDKFHHTFFEMLGNWSLGDYNRETAINYAWEFIINVLKLNKNKIAISIFGGNNDIPDYDKEAEKQWIKLGIRQEKIAKVPDNWWGPAGQTGPCGPDTEIFYWSSDEPVPNKFDPDDDNWTEIWNNVFMEFNKTADGKYQPLKQKNIDTGMGLERTVAALNNLADNYLTDLFLPIIEKLEKISGQKYNNNPRAFRIIADHLRSATFLLGDPQAITPSNTGQGYVLRRVIRRAVKFSKELNIENLFTAEIGKVVIKMFQATYPELKQNQQFILNELTKEEEQFKKCLVRGLKILHSELPEQLTSKFLFDMYQTYGFPLEGALEEVQKTRKLPEDEIHKFTEEFNNLMKEHQAKSRTASAGMFKGGLADHGEMSIKYHTVTHLLHQALRQVLGNHVEQRGSNINEERLRFDFTHSSKLTFEELKQVEDLVNQKIQQNLDIKQAEMTVEEAKAQGAIGLFTQKYGEKVKVYNIGDFSQEICGGPHMKNTSELGQFKIIKEESSSAGVRRIKAILS